ncbi:MAG TPA: DUF72 domain-containing protein [Gemmatimonadaceae bacterium]|jgi:uncharacterized protein YecE (DUF72 family)|nr:DUF72 domain-containing protein [Gemmatimonadaceae bacterium]
MAIYAGTSGWAYPSWKPDFYPEKLASKKFLEYYATRLNSVELNYTFRRFPTPNLFDSWLASTRPGFRFAVKANQRITHIQRLRDAGKVTSEFVAALAPLAENDRLGPILFQLPPFLRCDVDLLKAFLAELPVGTRAAFEFRHESWFVDAVYDALRAANQALCQAESETLDTPDVQTADFAYLRLRKTHYETDDLLRPVRALATRGDVFVYFKHEETAEGAVNATQLLSDLDAH